MQCDVCGSNIIKRVEYDQHVKKYGVWNIFKTVSKSIRYPFLYLCIGWLDTLIPSKYQKLKEVTRWISNPFGGMVSVCSCGYGYLNNPPSINTLKFYYTDRYWNAHIGRVQAVDPQAYKKNVRAKRQVAFVGDELKDSNISSILEIGAGEASSSLLLRDYLANPSIEIFTCEPGKQWEQYYSKVGIVNVADYFPFVTDKFFSYIHTSHWLEHVHTLTDTIVTLREMLDVNGYIFIEVPNTEFDYWNQNTLDTPHIHFFTPRSLKKVFEKEGFRCCKLDTFGPSNAQRMENTKYDNSVDNDQRDQGCWIRAVFQKKA